MFGDDYESASESHDTSLTAGAVAIDLDGSAPPTGTYKTISDNPPTWGGANPETEAKIFLKVFRAWIVTTKVPGNQQASLCLRQWTGALRSIINNMEDEDLYHTESGQKLHDAIQEE